MFPRFKESVEIWISTFLFVYSRVDQLIVDMIKKSTLSTQIHPILRWYIITSQHDSRGNLGQSEKVGYVSTIELIWLFCKHLTLFKVLTDLGVLLSIWLLTLASNWSQSLKCSTHRGNLGRSEKVGLLVNYGVNLTILCILTLFNIHLFDLFYHYLSDFWCPTEHLMIGPNCPEAWPKLPRWVEFPGQFGP